MHNNTYGVTADGIAYHQESKRWHSGRNLRLTVKYSFGNMRAKPNKNTMEVMDGSGYGDSME